VLVLLEVACWCGGRWGGEETEGGVSVVETGGDEGKVWCACVRE
jgi:hypothetical protein